TRGIGNMVSMTSQTGSTIQPASLMKARYGGGRIIYQVKPNQALYAQFKHVRGMPSRQEGGGLSLSKLRSIDNLIDRLIQLKNMSGNSEKSEAIDRMIKDLENKLESPEAEVAETLGQNAGDLNTLVNDQSAYFPAINFQGVLFSMTA
ncbi:MAG: hypothetical protein ACLFMZ_05510, partial [Spirochaetaceae bacterium]